MNATYLTLQQTEQSLVQAAATIYSGYIQAGNVEPGEEARWIQQAVKEALAIAKTIEDEVVAEGETG
jgi:hypothetical protein